MTPPTLRLQKTFAARTTSVARTAIVFCVLTTGATRGAAQLATAPRRESLSAEVNPFRGTLTYTRFATPRWELGVGLGFGFPQLDQTLFRKRDDFRDFLNVSALARRHFGKHALIEMGLRLGAAEYHECTASDCWPEVYLGPSILFAVGSERIKVGPRLTFGSIAAQGKDSDVFASVSPVNLLVSWRW